MLDGNLGAEGPFAWTAANVAEFLAGFHATTPEIDRRTMTVPVAIAFFGELGASSSPRREWRAHGWIGRGELGAFGPQSQLPCDIHVRYRRTDRSDRSDDSINRPLGTFYLRRGDVHLEEPAGIEVALWLDRVQLRALVRALGRHQSREHFPMLTLLLDPPTEPGTDLPSASIRGYSLRTWLVGIGDLNQCSIRDWGVQG